MIFHSYVSLPEGNQLKDMFSYVFLLLAYAKIFTTFLGTPRDAKVQDVLVDNGLRERVTLRVDGGVKTGWETRRKWIILRNGILVNLQNVDPISQKFLIIILRNG